MSIDFVNLPDLDMILSGLSTLDIAYLDDRVVSDVDYNPLIVRVEKMMAKTKKKKRKSMLKQLYLEIFNGFNKNSFMRSIYGTELNIKRQEQFIGFFMEELSRNDLDYLGSRLKKQHPDICRVEIRINSNDILYKFSTWTKINKGVVPMLPSESGCIDETVSSLDELEYLFEILDYGVDYFELSFSGKVFGGKDISSFKERDKPSLLVREEVHKLPKRYSRTSSDPSQFQIMKTYGMEHNERALLRECLKHVAGIDVATLSHVQKMAYLSFERRALEDDWIMDFVRRKAQNNYSNKILPKHVSNMLPSL